MKKRRTKVVELSGVRGIVFLGFCATCLFAGFVVFPGLVAQYVWNLATESLDIIPSISLLQGILLWGIVALTVYLMSGYNPFFSIKKTSELNDEEMRVLMGRIKERSNSVSSLSVRNVVFKSSEPVTSDKISEEDEKSLTDKNDKEKI